MRAENNMRQAIKITGGIVLGIVSLITLWIFFYILADKYTFYLSRTNINYASADMVIAMFNISLFASLGLSIVVTTVIMVFYFVLKKAFPCYVAACAFLQLALIGYILSTDNYIPFLRPWIF
jgi:hypothetical protein